MWASYKFMRLNTLFFGACWLLLNREKKSDSEIAMLAMNFIFPHKQTTTKNKQKKDLI